MRASSATQGVRAPTSAGPGLLPAAARCPSSSGIRSPTLRLAPYPCPGVVAAAHAARLIGHHHSPALPAIGQRHVCRSSSSGAAEPLPPTPSAPSPSPSTTPSPTPSATTSPGEAPHAGHAFLHDFCMTLPFGAIVVVSGIILTAMGAAAAGLPLAASGLSVLGLAVLSLKNWKKGTGSTPFTVLSALAGAYTCYMANILVQAQRVLWLAWPLVVLSGALSLFCAYNVLAGGNPPPRKHAAV